MKLSTIDKLCCPFDKGDLTLQVFGRDLDDHIHEGILTCQECKRYYPIIKGIPIMSPDEYREIALEQPALAAWEGRIEGKLAGGFKLLTAESSQ